MRTNYLCAISTPSSLHFSNRNLLISLTAARDTIPDTLSTVTRDETAADATVEPSVFMSANASDLALRSSNVTEGVTMTLTEKAWPLMGSRSSTLHMNACSGRVMMVFASVIALTMTLRSNESLTLHWTCP